MEEKYVIVKLAFINGELKDILKLGAFKNEPTIDDINLYLDYWCLDNVDQKQFGDLIKGENVIPFEAKVTPDFTGIFYKLLIL